MKYLTRKLLEASHSLLYSNEDITNNNNNNTNNKFDNGTLKTFENEEHSKLTMAILGIMYTLIFLIGISGNSLVVYVVCRKKTMQSVTNLFIMNLALSDILMCLLAVPFTPISFFQEYWILGKFLCHLIPFSLGISVYVSTLTSLAIAIDRYFVIVHPFKPRMKLGVCILLIGVVWVVSISISLPLAIYMELKPEEEISKSKCQESWPIPMSKRFFNLASLVLQYLIPFTVITYSYTKVWIILSNRSRPGKTKEKEQLELKRKKKTNRMLVAMVIIFAGCWMPLNCVHLAMEFKPKFTKDKNFSNVFFIAHVIAMSSTIYNPFLYAWLNDNFRKEFRLVIPWIFTALKWCRNMKTSSNSTTAAINQDETDNEEDHPENLKLMPRTFSMTHTTIGDTYDTKHEKHTGVNKKQFKSHSSKNNNNNNSKMLNSKKLRYKKVSLKSNLTTKNNHKNDDEQG